MIPTWGTQEMFDTLRDTDSDALTMDGMDEAIIGIVEQAGRELVLYSYTKLINVLVRQGMTTEEAEEWYVFNMTGYMGDSTPVVLTINVEPDK